MQTALLLLALIGVAFIGFIMTRSNTFRVTRHTQVNAPCDKPRQLVDDFRNWTRWSPYEKLDPDMERVYEGAPDGPGAIYRWNGKGKAGAGRMEIAEATPNLTIIRLKFLKPFPSENLSEFMFEPKEGGCEVTWSIHGENTFMGKAMSLFTSMDKMIGPDFERGLADLKAVSERRAA